MLMPTTRLPASNRWNVEGVRPEVLEHFTFENAESSGYGGQDEAVLLLGCTSPGLCAASKGMSLRVRKRLCTQPRCREYDAFATIVRRPVEKSLASGEAKKQ